MKIAAAVFGFLVLAVVFVLWFRAYRSIKGENESLFSADEAKSKKANNSLDEFIAAYKRGEVPMAAGTPAPAKHTVPPVAIAAAQSVPVRRDAFVSGSTKLVYLACKAGLRDHHIFAHVPLSALSTGGAIDPALARTGVDLLICNTAMSPIAAIDMIDAGNTPANAAKSDHLKALGIRYLRLSAKSLPRPDQWHALLYKM
jgi:hypothetical protein